MSSSFRLQFPGAMFHVMARGSGRRQIVRDDHDRRVFLEMLGETVERFRWILFTYALIPNHFHLLLQITGETLSEGLQWMNGKYGGYLRRRHRVVGQFFQSRPKTPLVEKESYFLQLLRYIALNPVHHGIVSSPQDYEWTSHRALLGECAAPSWLAVDDTLMAFAPERNAAQRLYRNFVDEGIASTRVLKEWETAPYLGSKEWLGSIREKIELKPRAEELLRVHRLVGRPTIADTITAVAETLRVGSAAVRGSRIGYGPMLTAWLGFHECLARKREIAAALGVSETTVKRLVDKCGAQLPANPILQSCLDATLATLRRKSVIWRVQPHEN